jgi:excinuclease UvrABC nuclease subunit
LFIHKNTAQNYVGSANLLRRRMDYYFKEEHPAMLAATYLFKVKEAGKFVPFLKKEGLKLLN